jgi:hypothetical protein
MRSSPPPYISRSHFSSTPTPNFGLRPVLDSEETTESIDELPDKCELVHGHLCPGQLLGVRVAVLGRGPGLKPPEV